MSTWWDRATDAQRLAQIDAGIALGMSSKQISMNLRVEVNEHGGGKVFNFANYHGRHFPRSRQRAIARSAGIIGGIVTCRRRGIPNCNINGSHEIFGTRDTEAYEIAVLDAEEMA